MGPQHRIHRSHIGQSSGPCRVSLHGDDRMLQTAYAGGASKVFNQRGQIVSGVLQVRRVIVAVKHRWPIMFLAVCRLRPFLFPSVRRLVLIINDNRVQGGGCRRGCTVRHRDHIPFVSIGQRISAGQRLASRARQGEPPFGARLPDGTHRPRPVRLVRLKSVRTTSRSRTGVRYASGGCCRLGSVVAIAVARGSRSRQPQRRHMHKQSQVHAQRQSVVVVTASAEPSNCSYPPSSPEINNSGWIDANSR